MSQTPGFKRVPSGDAAERVIRNIVALRGVRWRTLEQLSQDLKADGRHIPPLGLARLLRGDRRIDVDDLVALSRVLDVPVTGLLFDDVTVSVTCRKPDDS